TLCAVIVTALVVRRELFPPRPAAPPPQEVAQVSGWRAYAANGHRFGPADAPVSIVVFSDFQCPACRALVTQLRVIRAEFAGQVAVVHRHSPLRIHPFAVEAARASECAAAQGRFEAYHDALFVDQPSIGLAPWSRFAANAAVPDLPAFERCVTTPGPVPALERDTLDAKALRVAGTPTVLVNGLRFTGTPPLDTLRAYVRRAVSAAGREGRV
ncbi:MAG TPA: thioredoxin domain-containing protein, partial [Longimicrobiaceae bacterium]|nr:thioredoxin domain-containing protein [Longimicrobiaceae bacterium]